MDDILIKYAFEFMQFLVLVIAAAFARYAIPWMKSQNKYEKLRRAGFWADKIVRGLQQGAEISNDEKKLNAVEFIKEVADREGITLTAEEIDNLIEAAVWKMKTENTKVVIK